MNKQEAIEKINESRLAFAAILSRRNGKSSYFEKEVVVMKEKDLVDIINQIDEPEKPIIPRFVAKWLEKCKTFKNFAVSLSFALQPSIWEANRLSDECIEWLTDAENQDIFARAWLDGYEVEEKKLYTARLKVVTISYVNYINRRSADGAIILSDLNAASGNYQTSFTQSELEELNVWDNPAFEIEEVE